MTQAKVPERLPVVLTRENVNVVLGQLSGTHWLVCALLYGSGLRLMEAMRLRVKDVEFARGEVIVREGKAMKDRMTMLAEGIIALLKLHLAKAKALHNEDVANGYGEVYLPFALEKKYPSANKE